MGEPLPVEAAATLLHRGGVVAYPTEGVWGLGCDPFDQRTVLRLLAIKQRDVAKGLILIAAEAAQLDGLADWDALPAHRLDEVRASWPGPNTWVVPATARVPRWITGEHPAVAVRVSAHPVVAALCTAFGAPLVSTSANLAGMPAPATRDALDPALLDAIDGCVAGETGGRERPSDIRDACTGALLRGA